MKRVPTNLLEPNIVKVLVLRVCHDFSYFEKRYAHLTFKQHRAAHRGCGTKGVPAAGVSEASESYCSLSCLSFCQWWASSSSVDSSSVAAWAWEAGDVPGLEAGSVAGAEVPTGEILACVVAGNLKAAPVTLIVVGRTEGIQEVLMGEVAAREVRVCVPRCKTHS